MKARKTDEIIALWRSQLRKGYLKLAVLFALTKGPAHGYELMKYIEELTLGLLTPKAGALYPALKKLEENKLIKGTWKTQGKRRIKVYEITRKGKEVFQKTVERHFTIILAAKAMLLKELKQMGFIREIEETPGALAQTIRLLLLDENATKKERIEALEKLKQELGKLTETLNTAVTSIEKAIKQLKHASPQSLEKPPR
ncbi:hypothetical protein B6U79_04470 [Candidatus Bathyarchaeota archaeon ex4484_231]|nr:MAG: hypothetical protein B6U79_04470 [Candidatus Bathyarchaeota archaeon ex4484_231]